ncbi:uncharacterized protein LOC132544203 [Ylistrum balloti]|uniref:uncharacterized protein LOC132544203 n=1 Tax=Ylistrum balloti TaxID=509963 RepID=UPI002905F65D|nr:uncharacterized protein LOC132544203 [Ylistrum balloti]
MPKRPCKKRLFSRRRFKKRLGPPEPPQEGKSVGGLPTVSTPINIDMLELELSSHPDRTFVAYLLEGLRQGFDTGVRDIPETSLVCKNLLSARTQPDVVQELIDSELKKGFLAGPFETIPFPVYRINPIGIAEGKYSKKKRLIVDLSAPHDDKNNPSLNDLIDKNEYSLQYVTIDHAISVIKFLGQHSWLCKTDISDAFKLLPIHPSLWPFHGIMWSQKYYFYTRLVFGSRSSPKIFDTLSTAICWILKNRYQIHHVLHLLDDFLTVDAPNDNAEDTMVKLLEVFDTLNIPIAKHKTMGPATDLEYLGIILDTANMQARLPEQKINRICNFLVDFKDRKSCTKRET